MKINFTRLNHVQLSIRPDEQDAARDFYGRVLGLREIEKPDELKPNGGMWFEIADIQLHIGIEQAQQSLKRHPAFEVERLGQIKDYLSESGVTIKNEPSVAGFNRFSFFDPFGNRIELMERASDS